MHSARSKKKLKRGKICKEKNKQAMRIIYILVYWGLDMEENTFSHKINHFFILNEKSDDRSAMIDILRIKLKFRFLII